MSPWGRPGLNLPAAATPQQAIELAHLAEIGGAGAIWVPDVRRDPFVLAAAAVAGSVSVGVGTAVAVAFARSPTVTAASAWDLQSWSGGRFTLGLGTQVAALLRARFGVQAEHPAARMAEYVTAVRACFAAYRHGYGGHRGEFYAIRRPALDTGPDLDPPSDPPIRLAAVNPHMARVCGRVADGLIAHPFSTPGYLEEVVRPELARGAAEAGREAPPISVQLVVASSLEQAAMQLVPYAVPAYARVMAHLGLSGLIDEVGELTRGGRLKSAAAILADRAAGELGVIVARDASELAQGLERWAPVVDEVSLGVPWFGVGAAEQIQASTALAGWLAEI
ncbi:MAG TPA: LLM class flavin-dependent oxidoreductase [Candidatus Nitrosotalea sp.]|nr:LLM class flavin-dependent oxidoreductase [Candidatus Nitrosotalea sp.]